MAISFSLDGDLGPQRKPLESRSETTHSASRRVTEKDTHSVNHRVTEKDTHSVNHRVTD